MRRIDEHLDRAAAGPIDVGAPGKRGARRARRATTAALVVAVVAVTIVAVVVAQRGPADVELVPVPGERDETATVDAAPADAAPTDPQSADGAEVDEPAPPVEQARSDEQPPPGAQVPPDAAAPAAAPARIAVRDERLHLVDADGRVLRTLRDVHDGSQEYTLRDAALRPGSTTSDLAVAFVEGYMTSTLRVLTVREGGEAQVESLSTVDHERYDLQPMALPAGVWSPDGAVLAWLEPDEANRAMLRAVRWSSTGPAGDATPAVGIPVDTAGLMAADETRGLQLGAWEAGPVEHLRAAGYRPFEDGALRHYSIGVSHTDGQVHAQPLTRTAVE